MSPRADLFIANRWVPANGAEFQSFNPATHAIVWTGNEASKEDVAQAVAAARAAFPDWARRPVQERIVFLEAFGKELQQARDTLAEAISQETGKPLWESKSEVDAMAGKIGISIDAQNQRCATLTAIHPHARSIARHKPHGVVAVFGPFNFPGHLPNGHIVPALLAGNTVVFKPSELTPRVAQLTVQCWQRVGLPPGVLNLLQGGHETGSALADHSGIDGLFFTGSFATGQILSEKFAPLPGKILALELGGNNPLVVSHVEDVKAAALLTVQSAFLTSGQRCTCARRLILVEESCPTNFVEELLHLIEAIRIGPYTDDPEPFMGPVIHSAAASKVLHAQQHLLADGAKALQVSMQIDSRRPAFLTPGLIDVTTVSPLSDEEIFGPLLQLIRVPDFLSAIETANQTHYGLCAGLLSDREEEFQLFYQTVEAGVLNWNMPLTGASSAMPFGGIKQSGNNRPSALYAADYCNYPVASLEKSKLTMPLEWPPGLK
ncbi:MAG: succinylglutamate-semialdehyde dehydrogenase [Parachlamydia sp.]|nr:succinylglutamate-semialdehyde dehydrogenase [Parachlamydia sp.]